MRSLRFLIPAMILALSLVGCIPPTNTTPVPAVIVPVVVVPTVSSMVPAAQAVGVATNASLLANFSVAMDPLTLTTATFTLAQGATPVNGVVTKAATTATFTPSGNLGAGLVYTATLTTGVKSAAGVALASAHVWTFTSGVSADTTAPTVTAVVPADTATGVALNTTVVATFSEAMAPATLTGANFTLTQGGTPVAGSVTFTSTTATFTPTANLANSTTYTATVTTGVTDLAANALASLFTWSFTTVAAVPVGPAAVDLGTSANYIILAKTGITNVVGSATAITGDIALSPTFYAQITGFALALDSSNNFSTTNPASLVSGKVYAADGPSTVTPPLIGTAVVDMAAAYTAAANTTVPSPVVNTGAGHLGGLSLTPGVYSFNTSVDILTDLTLTGAVNDVFIFQITNNLSLASAKKVILGGELQAKNIFWQVAGSVELQANSVFNGVILCQTGIALLNGATVHGQLLAKTNVTLDLNTISP